MKFEEVEGILSEGLKYLKYSSAIYKIARKLNSNGKNDKEIETLKSLLLDAAEDFEELEEKYASSKSDKKEIKQQYKETKKKYAILVKKINIERALTGVAGGVAAGVIAILDTLKKKDEFNIPKNILV